MMLIIFSFSSN